MSRHKIRKQQVTATMPVQNVAPAKASTVGKAEGVETISGGRNRLVSPVITTAKIREIEDNALLQEPIQNLINLIFRGPAQVTVYDPSGETDDVLSDQAAKRYGGLDLYTAHQQALYDSCMGGCAVFSPGYDDAEKKDVFRHMPWHSFNRHPTMFTDTFNEIMPGIVVDSSTRKIRVFQMQSEAMVDPVEIQNFAIIRDPTGPAPAGKPMCLPVVPIIWNYDYAIKVIQQKLNRVGSPPVFPLAKVTASNKDLWENFARTWGKDTVFVLPPETTFADMKIVDNRVAEEYAAWLKKQAIDYWNPATPVQKEGNSIGGSDSGAMELIYNYIDRTLSWIENGITRATQNFLLSGNWQDDGGYLQRGYRVEIKHTRPSVSKDAAILAEVAELAKNGWITGNEARQQLPNTDLGEMDPETEAELQAAIKARQPQNPFQQSQQPMPWEPPEEIYQSIGNVQTPAQRTDVMSDTERDLVASVRKCAADVKRIALKDYPYKERSGFVERVKNLFAPVNNAGDEEGTWVTINGAHILMKKGETPSKAFKRTTGRDLWDEPSSSSPSASTSGTKKEESVSTESTSKTKGQGDNHSIAKEIQGTSNINDDAASLIRDGAANKEAKFDGYNYADSMEQKIPAETRDYGNTAFEESSRLRDYSENEYESINSSLRSGDFDKSEYGAMRDDIDTIIDDSPLLPQGIELYRGVGVNSGEALANAEIGSICSDAAFQSYSLNPATAAGFSKEWGDDEAHQTVIKVVTTGSEKGVYINTENHKEHEVIIARDTSWKVIGKETRNSINGASKIHIITVVKSDD